HDLMVYASEKLTAIEHVKLIGTAKNKASVVSFIIDGVNALDAGMYLDTLGIAVRTGHHCTQPVMDRLCIPGTIRASFMFYNTFEEIDGMVEGVKKAINLLRKWLQIIFKILFLIHNLLFQESEFVNQCCK
ncbi:MAG TPA: aminotransferase class V-fold PLP-dependent enzyme, partial [Bacteroidia bacterium]|nr:aminotransferase class V-fold PLP-dependent enzyme [Bacteroidia bacterium]